MHPAFMHDPWDNSTPTFRSVFHFSMLPQSQVNQVYFRGRRPGDVTLSSRRRSADDDFLATQNLLARRQYIAPKEWNERRRRNQSPRRERRAPGREQNSAQVPTSTTDSSLARPSPFSDIDWQEVLTKVILLAIALLLCAPTLRPVAGPETSGSVARTDSLKGLRYELVPDRKRWAVPQIVEQTATASSPSLSSAGLDSERSLDQAIPPTVLELAETIVPMINFGKMLGLVPKPSDSSVTTVSPVSTEGAVTGAWVPSTDFPAHSAPARAERTSSEVGEVSPISPGSSVITVSPVTNEESVEQEPESLDLSQTLFISSSPQQADSPFSTEESIAQGPGSLDDPQTPFTSLSPDNTEKTAKQAPGSSDLQTPSRPTYSNSRPTEAERSPVTLSTETAPEPTTATAETPRAPPDRPTSSSDVWHYCKQCSQWHG